MNALRSLHETFLLFEEDDDISAYKLIFVDMLSDSSKKIMAIVLDNLTVFLKRYYNKSMIIKDGQNEVTNNDNGTELKRKSTMMSNESNGYNSSDDNCRRNNVYALEEH